MIQIVALRPYDKDGEKAVAHKYGSMYDDIPTLFAASENYLAETPEKRYNLYWTLCHTMPNKREHFIKATAIAFDIDGIFTEEIEAYHELIGHALGIDINKCIIVHSGNGIQVIIKLHEEVKDKTWFKKHKKAYDFLCKKIDTSLEESGFPGKADRTVFEPARILRLPFTENRKPIKDPFGDDTVVKQATLYQNVFEDCGFRFDEKEIAEAALEEKLSEVEKKFNVVDDKAVIEGCSFLKYAKENAPTLEEPLWYAAIGITAWLEDQSYTHELSKGHSGYDPDETDKKIEQARAVAPRTCEDISARWDGCKACPNYLKVKTPVRIKSENFIATRKNGFTETIYMKSGEVKHKRRPDDLRLFFQEQHPYATIAEIKRVMVWKDMYYQPMADLDLGNFAQRHYFPIVEKQEDRNEFIHQLKAHHVRPLQHMIQHDLSDGKINCKNGIYDVKEDKLLEHTPEYFFQYILDYDYDPKATCPTWDQLLHNLCCGKRERIEIIEEFLGYILLGGDYCYNVALVLAGTGNNGKTTLINAIRDVVGHKNCSDISIQSMSRGFAAANLEGKLLNVCEEEPPSCFKETGMFKKATGDGYLQVERKFEQGYDMKNRAKIIMSYNEIPHLFDTTEGMKRRLLIVPFELDLSKTPELKIANLKTKLHFERSGILNRGLLGLKRLQARGGFSIPEETKAILKEMEHDADSVKFWWDNFITVTSKESDVRTLQEMYEHFVKEMEEGKERMQLSKQGFYKRVRAIGKKHGAEAKLLRLNGKTYRGVQGIILGSGEGVQPNDNF